jgi:hypothetical protein
LYFQFVRRTAVLIAFNIWHTQFTPLCAKPVKTTVEIGKLRGGPPVLVPEPPASTRSRRERPRRRNRQAPAMNSRRRRQSLICPSRFHGALSRQDSMAQASWGLPDRLCCTAEPRSRPPQVYVRDGSSAPARAFLVRFLLREQTCPPASHAARNAALARRGYRPPCRRGWRCL